MTASLRLRLGIFALISLLGVSFVGIRYLGWFDSAYAVYVAAPDAGGAYTHGAVAYRGVPVGRVGEVTVAEGGGARIELLIDAGTQVPADSIAVIANRSAVGEQYVDLRPSGAGGPYLSDGDELAEPARLPLPVESLLNNLDGLLESLDPDDVAVVVDELGAAFSGREDSLERLVEAANSVVADSLDHLPQTLQLLRDGQTALNTQLESADAIATWARELALLTETLAERDPEIRELIDEVPQAAGQVVDLLHDLDPSLGPLMGSLISVNGVAYRRLPQLQTVLVTFPMVVAGSFTVTPGDGTAHFGLALNFDNPPPCVYAEAGEPTCTEAELAQGTAVRGWQNAPGPTGPPVVPTPLGADPPEQNDGDYEPVEDEESETPLSSSSFGYDPVTGLIVDAGGRPVEFSDGTLSSQMAGPDSWKQLVLAGLRS